MHRLLLVAGLLAIGGCASDPTSRGDDPQDAPRIVQETRLPLQAERADARPAERRWTFTGPSAQGSLDASGAWSLRAEIEHRRLRCATYEAGIRVGRGNASCENVEWLTAPQFGAERLQCNQATVVHTGSGSVDLPPSTVGNVNCVGVLWRCRGAC
jgi:hypothetical protein